MVSIFLDGSVVAKVGSVEMGQGLYTKVNQAIDYSLSPLLPKEYVFCPSCRRTLFDLLEISTEIREKTNHFLGVSIAIMGCIVNGPRETAHADFGYMGGTLGKIDLYVGKEVVRRGIAMTKATNELISLIKEHGHWVDPEPREN